MFPLQQHYSDTHTHIIQCTGWYVMDRWFEWVDGLNEQMVWMDMWLDDPNIGILVWLNWWLSYRNLG